MCPHIICVINTLHFCGPLLHIQKGQTALHIAGLHSRPSCLQAMHTALAEREDSREELAKEEENPYLQTDKVRHMDICNTSMCILYVSLYLQTGYNVLHRICKGCRWSEEGNASVKTLKWLFETMPHLDLQTFHNLGTKVSSCVQFIYRSLH